MSEPSPGQPSDDHDAALARRVAEGSRAAHAQLVEEHQAPVFRFARSLAPDDATAEDIVQETFLAAIRGAHGFRADGTLRGWLFTIARRLAHRQRPREVAVPEDDELEALGRAAGWGATDDPEARLSEQEQRTRVARVLCSLSEDEREILGLRDVEGLSGPETAAALGLGLAAMKSRLHRARLRFAAALRSEVRDD